MRREGQARGAGKDSGGAGPKRAGLAGVGGESSFRSKICSNC